MKVLIVEDEKAAIRRLKTLFAEISAEIEVVGVTDTVKNTVKWFQENNHPDLAFFDIRLADGISFEVFDRVEVLCPVVFTTAYDQYALKAFEVNSIDYLLKPIDKEKLQKTFLKYRRLAGHTSSVAIDPLIVKNVLKMIGDEKYKERFVVKYGDHLKTIPVDSIDFFKSEAKATYLFNRDNRKYLIDYSLDQVENLIEPSLFFRINRKYIIYIHAIKDIFTYSTSRLRLKLHTVDDPDMIVAREKVQHFRKWLDK